MKGEVEARLPRVQGLRAEIDGKSDFDYRLPKLQWPEQSRRDRAEAKNSPRGKHMNAQWPRQTR